ncbi:MAG: hypothetical protein R3B52_00255 [Candidatus Paceibacterota bacterium]
MNKKVIEWALRIGIFGEFLGHGVFALQQKAGWLKYFNSVGISDATANTLMPYIGVMDILLAIIVLFVPFRLALAWMALWGLWTAMIRWPIGPDPIWDFFERWANWGAPLALLAFYGFPGKGKRWLRRK